jgi:hypothetical protein
VVAEFSTGSEKGRRYRDLDEVLADPDDSAGA